MEIVLLIGLLASWGVIVLLGLVLYQVLLQNGRTLLRLEAVEAQVFAPVDEYPVPEYLGMLPEGYPAPAFELPDLNGTRHHLSEWRGRRVILIFFDPNSTYCQRLLPFLVAMASDVVTNRPVPVLVSTGGIEANRALFDGAGYTQTVLLQSDTTVATAYKVDGAPMSYLIAEDGTIGSRMAVGIQHTMILAGEVASVNDATDAGPAPEITMTQPVLRTGLPEGATAPVFRLPKLDGGELSLLEYRGRDVFVVFSDPDCAPCDEVVPKLQEAYASGRGLPIIMISRGDPEANRDMVARLSLTFPVVLQRHWEISREYGIFATPAAFFVDEWGVIAADVAEGPEAVMELFFSVGGDAEIAASDRATRGV